MKPWERFKAWEKSHELVVATYLATRSWPKEELYGLTSQVRRAAYSAAANIVEGSARQGSREFSRFLAMSLASLQEVAYVLRLAHDLELLSSDIHERLDELRESAGTLTWKLFVALRRNGREREKVGL